MAYYFIYLLLTVFRYIPIYLIKSVRINRRLSVPIYRNKSVHTYMFPTSRSTVQLRPSLPHNCTFFLPNNNVTIYQVWIALNMFFALEHLKKAEAGPWTPACLGLFHTPQTPRKILHDKYER